MAARVTHGFRFAMGVAALAVLLLSRAPYEVRLSAGQAPAAADVVPQLSLEQQEALWARVKQQGL